MMYGSSRQRSRMNQPDLFLQRRVLLIVCILLLGLVIALGFVAVRNGTYRNRAEMQFSQRMYTAVSSAVNEVNRMGGYTTSSTNAQLSRIRTAVAKWRIIAVHLGIPRREQEEMSACFARS